VVFIDLEQLTDAVRGASGFGTTLAGQVLSPQLTRKLACDASIIPMVLGSQGQPLDVGRTKRLLRAHHTPTSTNKPSPPPSPPTTSPGTRD